MRKWRRRGEKDKQEQTLTEVRRGERETREVAQRQRSEGGEKERQERGRKKEIQISLKKDFLSLLLFLAF